MTDEQTPRWLRRAVFAGLLGGLLWVGFVVMRPFMVAIAWAAILTCVSWPLHLRLLARLRGHRSGAAFAMTVMLTLALFAVRESGLRSTRSTSIRKKRRRSHSARPSNRSAC